MAEDAEQVVGATEETTVTEDSSYREALAQGSPEPENSEAAAVQEEAQEPQFNPDEEQTVEIGGKTFTLKGKEILDVLENHQRLVEKEKSLLKDYTQKTQAVAEQRKSFESAFGRMPEPQEIQALGKLYNAYFKNPEAQKAIDAILTGKPLSSVLGSPNPDQTQNPEAAALQAKIDQLEAQLNQFTSGIEQEKQESAYNEGKRHWEMWVEKKASEGVKIEDESEIDAILETAGLLLKRNPTWDQQKALEEAYRRENLEAIEKDAQRKVLGKASDAKNAPKIKITPKAPAKSESEMSYSEIIRNAS